MTWVYKPTFTRSYANMYMCDHPLMFILMVHSLEGSIHCNMSQLATKMCGNMHIPASFSLYRTTYQARCELSGEPIGSHHIIVTLHSTHFTGEITLLGSRTPMQRLQCPCSKSRLCNLDTPMMDGQVSIYTCHQ